MLNSYLSLDIEASKKDGHIRKFGAIRSDSEASMTHAGRNIERALEALDRFAEGTSFLIGHNLIEFDLPILKAAKPSLNILKLPILDTLWLSPLAFPKNPYHKLIKHYQDASLKRGKVNDPELDARLTISLFIDLQEQFPQCELDLLTAWHWLCAAPPNYPHDAFEQFFAQIRGRSRPSQSEAALAIKNLLAHETCSTHTQTIVNDVNAHGWSLAYALAWLSVAGGNSVIPPWVRHYKPEVSRLVNLLRDTPCTNPNCVWCRERHDPVKELQRWFNFHEFRSEPACDDGRPMQQAIVEQAMAGKHVFGILPTGAGKSLCYQIPALSRYYKTGALTVVISPLVALMADQVAGLEKRGIGCCVTVNGLLSMPERADALDRVRLGDAGILLISPEQLRSRSLVSCLKQREIGSWVLDEAHCLSRWGHDFRPDYRYVGRFIRRQAGKESIPPVLCLTATAKPDVIQDIENYFSNRIGIELLVFNGGSERINLSFEVVETTSGEKFSDIFQILSNYLPDDRSGGAIVYCATRKQSQEVSEFLQQKGVAGDHFHAKLPPETKKDVQRRFIQGELRAIAATNAFGMGIDKPDVRLVIHADIPGSLENYLQEAGRAGRDREAAHCVLLYTEDDVERQFSLSAYSRLTRSEIHGVLRALRNLDHKKRFRGNVVATSGEILGEDDEQVFQRDSTTDDTRVRTAVAWLEESQLLTREENDVQVFPSSLRVDSIEEVESRLATKDIDTRYRGCLLAIASELINADPDEGISTDDLMLISGLESEGVRKALYDLETFGIASNDTALTAFVHDRVANSSNKRLENASELEIALISLMRLKAPDLGKGESSQLHLRLASQALRDLGLVDPLPERLWRIVRGIAFDGRGEDGKPGSLTARKIDAETVRIELHRDWNSLEKTASIRRDAATILLTHLLSCLPKSSRGTDLLVETTIGNLLKVMQADAVLRGRMKDPRKLMDRALLWLHEQEVIRLNKGLAVFRPAMTIKLDIGKPRRGFAQTDFKPLSLHYQGQTLQIHVMVEFANRGIENMTDALRLATDYFTLNEVEFLRHWMPNRKKEIGRQTTPKSWRAIVESLNNSVQQRIVANEREENTLVLAGPGSGKTRVLVHRIAWLIRVQRENPKGILALAYNRHAAVEIRKRLAQLVGKDAVGVTVLTCHGLAMRLAGKSFSSLLDQPDSHQFDEVIAAATSLLKGDGLIAEEADDQRARLLAGFRWILVDEYQDVAEPQYELIAAIAGRSLQDKDSKLALFAVGDDDQNIYAFNGASVEFIRRFEADYEAKPEYLTDNYRSTGHIISAANAIIKPAIERMKANNPIKIDRQRVTNPMGGEWEQLDPLTNGRVQILPTGDSDSQQAQAVALELSRLSTLDSQWHWKHCAVIGRNWRELIPVRAHCEALKIPVQMANEQIPNVWRIRQTVELVNWLQKVENKVIDSSHVHSWLNQRSNDPWNELLLEAVREHEVEYGDGEFVADHFVEWLAEWSRDIRRRQNGLLLLTAHRAKGLEFDHVMILDGSWHRVGETEDPDAPRRLYYVAMTRARKTLTLARSSGHSSFVDGLAGHPSAIWRMASDLPPAKESANRLKQSLTLRDVHIDYVGRYRMEHTTHQVVSSLCIGDLLEVRKGKHGSLDIFALGGQQVGRLSKRFEIPARMRIRSAKVYAVVTRKKSDSESDGHYSASLNCNSWEVVLPELTFEPL